MSEKWETVQSSTKKESYQSNAESKQGNIELVNIPGPPYNHLAENQIHPQNTLDQTPSLLQSGRKTYQTKSQKFIPGEEDESKKQRSIMLPAIDNKRNINHSAKFQHLKLPHGSGNNPLKQNRELPKRNSSRPDPFKNEIKTQEDLRRKLKNFTYEPFQNFPGFESFNIDFGPNQEGN